MLLLLLLWTFSIYLRCLGILGYMDRDVIFLELGRI